MDIRPIHTDADYRAALREVSALMSADPEPGTREGDRLDIRKTVVRMTASRPPKSLTIPGRK